MFKQRRLPFEPPFSLSFHHPTPVSKASRERRAVNNKSAIWTPRPNSNKKSQQKSEAGTVIPSAKRQNEYQGYRTGMPERTIVFSSLPILIGAAMIAAAILLSTLVNALGTRYFGFEGPTEDSAWLVDRLTGHVYRCEASSRGQASCEPDIATGSIPSKPKPE
jgi:hypothetical protein